MGEIPPPFSTWADLPPTLQEIVPNDWVAGPIPDDTQLHPVTYQVAELWAQFADRRMAGYARKQGGDAMDEKDITQSALTGFMSTHKDRAPDLVQGHLITGILRNKISDEFRRLRRARVNFSDDLSEHPATAMEASAEDIVLSDISKNGDLETVNRYGRLNDRELSLIALEVAAGRQLSSKEAAEALGSTPGAIRVMRHRMQAKIGKSSLPKHLQASGQAGAHSKGAKKQTAKPDISSVGKARVQALQSLRQSRRSHAAHTGMVVPAYVGIWQVVARDMAEHLKEQPDTHGLIVYPHDQHIPALAQRLGGLAGRPVRTTAEALLSPREPALIIDTPASMAGYSTEDFRTLPVSYTAQLREHYRHFPLATSGLFRLTIGTDYETRSAQPPRGSKTYPTYRAAGGKKIVWEPHDSINYLQDYLLTTGEQLDNAAIERLHRAGLGPGMRRLCRSIGSFIALQIEAGYTPKIPAAKRRPLQ